MNRAQMDDHWLPDHGVGPLQPGASSPRPLVRSRILDVLDDGRCVVQSTLTVPAGIFPAGIGGDGPDEAA